MVTALQTLVTRKFNVFDPVVITVGSFHAGTIDNVIPDEATFLATARVLQPGLAPSTLAEVVPQLIGDIARGHGLTAETRYAAEYPVTVNDAAEAAFAGEVIAATFGAGTRRAGRVPDHRGGGFLVRPGAGARSVRLPGRLPARQPSR